MSNAKFSIFVTRYKGYTALIRQTEDYGDLLFHGNVTGINDLLVFEGETHEEAIQAFHDIIDDYLATCEEIGKEPEKTVDTSTMEGRLLQEHLDELPDPKTRKEKARVTLIKACSTLGDLADSLRDVAKYLGGEAE